MSLYTQLRNDLTAAMKAKDVVKKDTLRLLISEVQLKKKEKPDLIDDDILTIIIKSIKRRDEAIEAATTGGRINIIIKESAEKAVLTAYLPKQLVHDEVLVMVAAAINQSYATTKRDLGLVMKLIVPQIKGKFDAKVAKDMVLNRLGD